MSVISDSKLKMDGEKKMVKKSEELEKGKNNKPEGKKSKFWKWGGKKGEKKLGRQNSRFEKSMRVLEWLDADCGTKLTQHYEQAGGWRSLPKRKIRQVSTLSPQRRQLRVTRSHMILGTDTSATTKKVVDSCSSDDDDDDDDDDEEEEEEEEEEVKIILEDSEDYLDNERDYDEDDLVLALRGLQEDVMKTKDQIEDLSMKEYVTSSDEDVKSGEEESDSEDELVLALKAWKDEQLRQERLLQQLHKHRQNSLATQPPVLTPVLEDKVLSPTSQAFGYFYQDNRSFVNYYSADKKVYQNGNHHNYSSAPYWWGGLSSVREGPSSPPILNNHSEFGSTPSLLVSPRFETARSRETGTGNTPTLSETDKTISKLPGSIPFLTVTTAASTSGLYGSVNSLNTPLSPFVSSSSKQMNSNWSSNRAKSPVPTPVMEFNYLSTKGPYLVNKTPDNTTKVDFALSSPRTPLTSRPSSGGFSVLSSWLGSSSGEKQTPSNIDISSDAKNNDSALKHGHHISLCPTLSNASSDSGIERSPGYLSPAPRSAGIDKIGDFFRRFHHKLASSSSSPSSSTKTTPPATPIKQQSQQQQQRQPNSPKGSPTRRLSLSTSSIPTSSLLKPTSSSPLSKVAAAHVKCTFTKSDPLATGNLSKHTNNHWKNGQFSKGQTTLGNSSPLAASSRLQIENTTILFSPSREGKVLDADESGRLASNSSATDSGSLLSSVTRLGQPHDLTKDSTYENNDFIKSGNAVTSSSCYNSVSVNSFSEKDNQPILNNLQPNDSNYFTSDIQQISTTKRATGDSKKLHTTLEATENDSLISNSLQPLDKYNALNKSTEVLDTTINENELSSGYPSSYFLGLTKLGKAASQILRKSPVSDFDSSIISGSCSEIEKSKSNQGEGSFVVCGGSPEKRDNTTVVRRIHSRIEGDIKGKGSKPDDEIMCSEISGSNICDERGTLSVPTSMQDRGRRGSHGSCNYLFIEQAGGRKSPKPATKGRTSPSPVRGTLFKSAVNSTSTSSSSSAESSSKIHHQMISRVQSLPSPSSPPPHHHHHHHTPKTSPKHLVNSNQNNTTESPSRTSTISDGSPTNYHGGRKFSDTGLPTPVPRRLFNDGRRGSLTDERTLVSAKSKLGKLRNQGRKSSDAGSVAVLVKQIHNLWGDKDDEPGDLLHPSETSGSLTCSVDDQVLFDKRRKRFSLSIGRNKDNAFGFEEKKVSKHLGNVSEIQKENEKIDRSSGIDNVSDVKAKKKAQKKSTHLSLISLNTSTPVSRDQIASSTDDIGCTNLGKICSEESSTKKESASVDSSGKVTSASSTFGSCSEFIAPVAHVASRQLVATAMSSAAPLVGMESTDSFLNKAAIGFSLTNIPEQSLSSLTPKSGKKSATVQFQPIVSWDDNIVGGKPSPALKSVLKSGARRHSSFAGFSDSIDDLSVSQTNTTTISALKKQSKNALPKSKTSDNYKGILKQTDKQTDSITSPVVDKKRAKSPSPKTKKHEEDFDQSTEGAFTLCMKATRSVSPKAKKTKEDAKRGQEELEDSFHSVGTSCSDSEPFGETDLSSNFHTKTVGIQATPRTVGKTSNTGTQTADLSDDDEFNSDYPNGSDGSGWLQRLAAKCIASVGSPSRPCVPGGLPRAASVRADWLLGNKRIGSGPNSPVVSHMDPTGRFWVPHELLARKRAQSLIPTLSKSEDDLSSEELTPSTNNRPRDLAFVFPNERTAAAGVPPDGHPSTPTTGYNLSKRRASMHDAIDLNKIDTRLYDKKLVRQDSVSSIEEESRGTIHISLQHNSETNILTIVLVRAHNLLPRDAEGTANPYCRLTLLPAQRTSAQCRIHRKTLNPIFEEEFIFEVTAEEVSSSTLEVSVYEYDQFSTDECVGYVRIRLDEFDLSKQVDLWRSISAYDKPKDQKNFGDVMFSVSYLPSAERLTVVIVKARNLRLSDETKVDINPFIKVWITSGNKKLKKKKTSTAHGTGAPTWNEALVFSVHKEKLVSIGLEISAFHENKLGIDECIGRVRLLSDCEEGINCQDLLSEKGMPAKWYSLS